MPNQNAENISQQGAIAKVQPSASVRFTDKVLAEFGGGVGDIALTGFQRRLAQNYFIAIDAALRMAEEKRLKKRKNQDPLPIAWENVNMGLLARSVVSKARIGLDPAQKNHVSMMPFKNNALNKYDIVFIDGYRGIEMTAIKYGQDVPDAVIVELVYSGDHFKSHKKSLDNPVESYEFEIVDDFNRGEVKGGFYYHAFKDNPEKNKLTVMSMKDILKRKPAYASVEFWGGEKDIWDNGKKVGTEHTDGWFEKMCYKTVYRAAWSDITIDSQKIDQSYLELRQIEDSYHETAAVQEIEDCANSEAIDVDYDMMPNADPETGEILENEPQEDPDFDTQQTSGDEYESPQSEKQATAKDPF
ncbi:MAG: recombinase RecT [Oscillospiraceae bacterium]